MKKKFNFKKTVRKIFVDEKAVAKKQLIAEMSEAMGLKKIYFECLSEEKFNQEVKEYRKLKYGNQLEVQ